MRLMIAPLEDKMAMWNTFLNTFAKHLGFFRLKMSEAYSLPISVVESICHDMQILFDAYQQHLVASVTSCMNMFNVNWKDDALMSEILSHTSLFEKCNSKFKTDYLFSKYLAEELKMNIPVTCTVSNPVITETHGASVEPQEMLQANHIDLTENSMSNCLSDSVCGEKSLFLSSSSPIFSSSFLFCPSSLRKLNPRTSGRISVYGQFLKHLYLIRTDKLLCVV
jgi:hypothetical protein